jgi:hypothetical protein
MNTIFWLGNLKVRNHLEDLGVDRMIILKWILGSRVGSCVDWLHLVQDRDQWRIFVNTVMNLWVP